MASVTHSFMKLKIFAYKDCDTCRKAIHYLERQGIPFEVIPIREQPPALDELMRMLCIYNGAIRKLFNTSGQDYKTMDLKSKLPKMSEKEALDLLAKHGNLVKRPFLLMKNRGVVGFKEDEWKMLLKHG